MKRKVLTLLLSIVIGVTSILSWNMNVKAEGEGEDIAMSELMTDSALIGYAQNQTWGVYFSDGYSIINKISSTKIGAGGVTNASVKCTVKVTAIVEKKLASGSWARVTSWSQTNTNAYSAMASKSLVVASNYYYRVRCYHYASTDSATSYTGALWVGN